MNLYRLNSKRNNFRIGYPYFVITDNRLGCGVHYYFIFSVEEDLILRLKYKKRFLKLYKKLNNESKPSPQIYKKRYLLGWIRILDTRIDHAYSVADENINKLMESVLNELI